ncbi:MAG TPA: hypothetical protein VGL81_32390 [Polyangiaceae bacterium]|jgi:hypothetical protein
MRITVIDQQRGNARHYDIGSGANVGALSVAVARDNGHGSNAGAFMLTTMNGSPLSAHSKVGEACRDGGIYTLAQRRPATALAG